MIFLTFYLKESIALTGGTDGVKNHFFIPPCCDKLIP
jgi:hypothetical protein